MGLRLIPAWAGKTVLLHMSSDSGGAHPRVGGENAGGASETVGSDGSSPRGRGKRSHWAAQTKRLGLIPAWAGKTVGVGVDDVGVQAHPRVGGENHIR